MPRHDDEEARVRDFRDLYWEIERERLWKILAVTSAIVWNPNRTEVRWLECLRLEVRRLRFCFVWEFSKRRTSLERDFWALMREMICLVPLRWSFESMFLKISGNPRVVRDLGEDLVSLRRSLRFSMWALFV